MKIKKEILLLIVPVLITCSSYYIQRHTFRIDVFTVDTNFVEDTISYIFTCGDFVEDGKSDSSKKFECSDHIKPLLNLKNS